MPRRATPSIVWACGSRQQLYEKTGRYEPEKVADVLTEVYEDEGYMVPYMWAAILIYPFWPSMISHIALYRDDFLKAVPPGAKVLELASGHGVLSLLGGRDKTGHPTGRFRHQSARGGGGKSAAGGFRAW